MADKTSVATGLWSADATWNPAGVPADGDHVTIASGHIVTFDVDQSAWSTGLTGLHIHGTLKFKTDGNTYLKMAAKIEEDDGYLYIGNSTSDRLGAAYTAQVEWLGDYGITMNHIAMYGAVKNHKGQLAADAALGTADLVFTTDVGLSAGDRLIIMTCSAGRNAEDKIVQSYNAGTKTATLTTNLASNHYIGDYVAILTRNIRFLFVTGQKGKHIKDKSGGHVEYVWFKGQQYGAFGQYAVYALGCVFSDPDNINQYGQANQDFVDCVFIGKSGEGNIAWGSNRRFINCLIAMAQYGGIDNECDDTCESSVFFNTENGGVRGCWHCYFHDCKFLYCTAGGFSYGVAHEATDCYFKGNTYGHLFRCRSIVVRNPEFADGDAWYAGDEDERKETDGTWVHDYNKTAGDHRAKQKGGEVSSESTTVHWGPKSLRLKCLSSTYHVSAHLSKVPFKNGVQRSISFYVRKNHSMSGWLPRVYLFKPGHNPIMFPAQIPLATFTMGADTNDAWVAVTGTYTHTADEVLEFIAVAKHDEGYVYFADLVVM